MAVINFPGKTAHDLPASQVLGAASNADLKAATVVGWHQDGSLYFASTEGSLPETLVLLRLAEKRLLELIDD